MNYLKLFSKLPHLNILKEAVRDFGFVPNLFQNSGLWYVSWINYFNGDTLENYTFIGDTPEEAIQKAYDYIHHPTTED